MIKLGAHLGAHLDPAHLDSAHLSPAHLDLAHLVRTVQSPTPVLSNFEGWGIWRGSRIGRLCSLNHNPAESIRPRVWGGQVDTLDQGGLDQGGLDQGGLEWGSRWAGVGFKVGCIKVGWSRWAKTRWARFTKPVVMYEIWYRWELFAILANSKSKVYNSRGFVQSSARRISLKH